MFGDAPNKLWLKLGDGPNLLTNQPTKVSLWQAHPYAEPLQIALVTLLRYFDLPATMGIRKV
jgi:hypothetical protein